ncbi:putative oxalocrotonate tautomerase [Cercophora newfieldiana]|uniref:Oxalocrotonate tautomerase n=1 Tax=Cercophora newfieldiana TaxID=92897 RepID=A0AA40CJ63_9PEZI|nr:putative oxalocrotonate tautomerase [Cercophora newfieldiana]
MPLWLVFHPEGTFVTPESKQALAADVTTLYTGGGLPAFYVNVNFITLPQTSMFVGGQIPSPERPFIRFMVDHLAVHFKDNAMRQLRVINRLDELIKPHVADKGYDWEFHIDETPRELWKINGFIPPPHRSEAEAMWAKNNKPSEWKL